MKKSAWYCLLVSHDPFVSSLSGRLVCYRCGNIRMGYSKPVAWLRGWRTEWGRR